MIKDLQKKWTILYKQREKDTEIQKTNWAIFLKRLGSLFWAVSPYYENMLNTSSDHRKVQDREWLNGHTTTGIGSLGAVD